MRERKNPIATLPGAKRLEKKFSDRLVRHMAENAVPEIVRTVQDRQLLAAETRFNTTKRRS